MYEAETNKSVPTEPQLLDAICDMKPTAAVNDNFGILVLPILDKENKIYLFEFKAQLMRLKTEEESNGILQCTRILSSLEEQTPKLRIPENVYKITKKSRNSSNKTVKLSKNSSSSSFYNLDVNINTEDPKMPFIPLSLKNIHDEDGITSTSVFDLSSAHSKSDKFIIVSSSRPNINPQSFEMQLEKDKLQIYPFDPFLTSILMSFSKLSTRQLDLHHKIVNMKEIKPVVRSLHLLGNVLACPMPFTDLLWILMVSFTNLFGKCVKLEIFDPPLHDEQETDPNALNLERDRKIYASIKISSPMTPDKSMALSYFADLVLALLASRDEQKPDSPMEVLSIPVLSPELGYNFFNMNVHENVSICAEIFSQFKVNDVLNVSKECVSIWLWRLANNPEEDRFFLTSLDSLQLAYSIFTTYDLFSYFTDSELCAACISFFVRSGFPHMRPDFKYSSYLKHFSKLSNKVLVRITTAMIILADPYCDLLEMSSEETVCGVLEYMIHSSSISVPLLISKMTFVGRRGIDFENINHRLLFTMLVTELSQSSYFFRSIDVFNQYCLLSMESQKMLLYKAQKIVHPYIKVLDLITQQQSIFYRAFSDKVSWLNLKGKTYFQQQHQEEEELGNMSLFDAR